MKDRVYSIGTKAWQICLGCREDLSCSPNCWAKRTVNRLAHSPNEKVRAAHAGLVTELHHVGAGEGEHLHWSGTVRLNEAHLLDPLSRRDGWNKPQIVATAYHGDWSLLPDADKDRIVAVATLAYQHEYLTLTKRPENLVSYLLDPNRRQWVEETAGRKIMGIKGPAITEHWPPRHVHIGVSIMAQADADRMLPVLMQLAAAGWHTWVSIEPCLGPVVIAPWLRDRCNDCGGERHYWNRNCDARGWTPPLDFVVVGGESGSGARPCKLAWIRSIVRQCADANVPCFVKQLGSFWARKRNLDPEQWEQINRSGSDPLEWQPDLRVQQLPEPLARILEGKTP